MSNIRQISEILNKFNKFNVDFIILRKPEMIFKKNNDIDILLSYKNLNTINKIFKNTSLISYKDNKYSNVYLYGSHSHWHFYNKKSEINFDLCFDISYRSINEKEFVPIDDDELIKIWANKIKVNCDNFFYFQMDERSQLLHYICHSIFDKNNFSDYYSSQINDLIKKIDKKTFIDIAKPFFYKYSERLFDLISNQKFKIIFNDYLTFKEY